jgi:hypothetical protein
MSSRRTTPDLADLIQRVENNIKETRAIIDRSSRTVRAAKLLIAAAREEKKRRINR